MKAGIADRPRRDRALSEVVGFVLLLGVLVAAMALWMMYVVPVTGREDEITQMNAVKDRFTDYKITLDSLWINSNNPSVATMAGVTASTSFDLGTGGGNTQANGLFIPLLRPVASSAKMSLIDGGDTLAITSGGGTTSLDSSYPIQRIEYQSQNNYWIQQKYIYQGGGVFLTQDSGATTRVAPSISVVNNTATNADDLSLSVTVAPISLDGGASIGGNGPVRVDSRLKTISPALGPDKKAWVNISVTNLPDHTTAEMWNATFLDLLNNGGVTNASWYTTGVTPDGAATQGAFMYVHGPRDTTEDVWLTIHPAQFAVTFNNIATGIT